MGDIPRHSNTHPPSYGNISAIDEAHGSLIRPAGSTSPPLSLLESPIELFESSRHKADHVQERRTTKQIPLGKRKSWLSCRRLEMVEQEDVEDDSCNLSFRMFVNGGNDSFSDSSSCQNIHSPLVSSISPPSPVFCKNLPLEEEEEEDKSILTKESNGDDKNHSFKFFQYILEDRGEKELNFDVYKTSNKTFTSLDARSNDFELIESHGSQFSDPKPEQVAGNPNSSLQTRKNLTTSSRESSSALKQAQRALSRVRFGRMLTVTCNKKDLLERFSPKKFKRRLLGLAMKMNAKRKKALALKNDTKNTLALKNDTTGQANDDEEEEFWKKKILMGRRCRPLKMDDDDDDEAYQESSRAAKVAPWMTIEEKLADRTVDNARKISEDGKQNMEKKSSFRELMHMVDKLGI